MLGIRKLKNQVVRLKESAQDLFFTYFPIKIEDRDVPKLLNLKKIGNIEIKNIDEIKTSVYSYFCGRKEAVFYFSEEEKEEILRILSNYYPDNQAETLREADFIIDHKMKIYGSIRYDLGKTIDWSLDVLSGEKWPMSYYKNIRLSRHITKGDILYTAKINRHQYLTTLARAYLYSRNLKYRQELVNQITDWIQKNPYKMGINWWSPLVVCQRALSWIWSLALVGFHNIDKANFWEILKALYLHATFIEENLSTHWEYPNNHLIGEAATLTMIGIFFPEFYEAEQWKRKGWEILEKELSRQFFDSGVHKEQALAYHSFVVEFYTQVYLLGRKTNLETSSLSKRLEQMYEFLMRIGQPGDTTPMLGDSSDLEAVHLSDKKDGSLNAFFCMGSVLFNRTDMKKLAGRFREEALWLLTAKGYNAFQALGETEVKESSHAYEDAGIFVMRDGWQQASRYLVVDCGPQGLGRAGHGHADMLSFELWANGKQLLIDPGTFMYNGPYVWRHYFRGTYAHNTVIVDGLDQSEVNPGPFGWRSLAQPRFLSWYSSEDFDYFEGGHDGYERLPQPVKHYRKILFVKGEYWIISDLLIGEGKHTIDCLLHFPPGKVLLNKEDKSLITCDTQSNLKIVPLNRGIEAEVIEGCENPIQGWVSYEYGSKIKAPVLQYTQHDKLPVFFNTILYPFTGQNEPHIGIEEIAVYSKQGHTLNSSEVLCLKVRMNKVEDYYLYSTDFKKNNLPQPLPWQGEGEEVVEKHFLKPSIKNTRVKYFENFATDGRALYLRKLDNKITKSLIVEGTFLSYENIHIPSKIFS